MKHDEIDRGPVDSAVARSADSESDHERIPGAHAPGFMPASASRTPKSSVRILLNGSKMRPLLRKLLLEVTSMTLRIFASLFSFVLGIAFVTATTPVVRYVEK